MRHDAVMDTVRSLTDLTATELLRGYADRSLSPVDVLDAVTARVAEAEPTLHALWLNYASQARASALASEARWRAGRPCGPLDGVPITLKENIATEGVPVPLGTRASELTPAAQDAPPAARAREAGAILLGKTTMPDYGMLTSGLSSFHGLTRNPWQPDWNPGGSSAGAAAAGAAGYGPLHVGTDIGGSVRLPAGWTGLVGVKPSNGRVPIDPPYIGRVAGPLTRTVEDAALLLSVLARPDARDYLSLPPQDLDWSDVEGSVRGLRVGLLLAAGAGLAVEPEVAAAVRGAAAVFEAAGAVVEPVEPFFSAEMLHDVDLFWRVRAWADFVELPVERQRLVLPYFVTWCLGGADVPGSVVLRCVNRILEVNKVTLAATERFDLVLSPVCPVPAIDADAPSPTGDPGRAMEHIAFTVPFNLSGQPAAAVNCGFTGEGKPIGVQISGRRFADLGVLRAARFYEQARPAEATPDWSRCVGWRGWSA